MIISGFLRQLINRGFLHLIYIKRQDNELVISITKDGCMLDDKVHILFKILNTSSKCFLYMIVMMHSELQQERVHVFI